MSRLRITEIFCSLQGESRTVGWPTVFVRLTGCPLRCGYCDTAYAFKGGEWKTIDEILQEVAAFRVKHVAVTGGEPLAQKECLQLLRQLCDVGYQVSLETSGSLDIASVDPRVERVVDLKTPGSGEMDKNLISNIDQLHAKDQLKFVICNREDYDWARQMLVDHRLDERCEILFSPSANELAAVDLANWIVDDRLPVRFQLQIHKILWGDKPGV